MELIKANALAADETAEFLYYTKSNGSIYRSHPKTAEESVLIPAKSEDEGADSDLLVAGDCLYYAWNESGKSTINAYQLTDGTTKTILELADSSGDASGDKDAHLMGLWGKQLIFAYGECPDYTAQVLDLEGGQTTKMMKPAGDLIGVYQEQYVFMSYVSDAVTRILSVYDSNGKVTFSTESYQAAYLDAETGHLYFRDDHAYAELMKNSEDPNYDNSHFDEDMQAIEDGPVTFLDYCLESKESAVYCKKEDYYMSYISMDGLITTTDSSALHKSSIAAGLEGGKEMQYDGNDVPFKAGGQYFTLEKNVLCRMDFLSGTMEKLDDLSDAISAYDHPRIYWCGVFKKTEDRTILEKLAYCASDGEHTSSGVAEVHNK